MIYYKIVDGKRVYTLDNKYDTVNPAKFSTDDKFSDERIEMKKRFGIFPFDDEKGI